MLANQIDAMPTNKMIVLALMTVLVHHLGGIALPPHVMEAYGVLFSVLVGFVTAYMTSDRLNIPKDSR